MSGAEIDAKILKALKKSLQGISNSTGVSYAYVVNWMKDNAAKVRTEGERKGKRVILS